MTDLKQLLYLSAHAALDAGKEIIEVYNTAFTVTLKEDKSPLTQADQRAHRRIAARLQNTRIPLLSEEGRQIPYSERSTWKQFWLVDPLDGTKEFVNRNGDFTVNIALIESGKPVSGVIYAPVPDILYYGSAEIPSRRITGASSLKFFSDPGAVQIEEFMNLGETLPLNHSNRPFTVVASRSHMSSSTRTFIENLEKEHKNLEIISRGSSLKICLVAEGSADVYPRLGPTMEWDTAAGNALAEFAGCSVMNAEDGSPMRYNKEDLLNPYFVVSRP